VDGLLVQPLLSHKVSAMNPYLQEVIDLHVQTDALFTIGEGESMVEHFHPASLMVTPSDI